MVVAVGVGSEVVGSGLGVIVAAVVRSDVGVFVGRGGLAGCFGVVVDGAGVVGSAVGVVVGRADPVGSGVGDLVGRADLVGSGVGGTVAAAVVGL